jgi:hypothetical protein
LWSITAVPGEPNFEKLNEEYGDVLRSSSLPLFFIAICGFQSAQARVENELAELALPFKVHLCDPLDDADRCFSGSSKIFHDQAERLRAQEICLQVGSRIDREAPLGYGGCQAAVIFANTCPDNTLPIFWGESKSWKSLFKRT